VLMRASVDAKHPLPLGEDRVRAYEIENRALTT
jgi:hypothetical protein